MQKSKKSKQISKLKKICDEGRHSKKQVKKKNMFVEEEASVASSDEEESDDEEAEIKNRDNQYYNPEALKKRYDQAGRLRQIEEKAQKGELAGSDEEEGFTDEEEEEEMGRDGLQPSVSDPRLWQVRVKRGLERQVCMSLINKSIDYARKGSPLAILSATCNENVEGYIYIEAFKEIHVREGIKGLSAVLGNKLQLVELSEMTAIYYNATGAGDRDRIHLDRH